MLVNCAQPASRIDLLRPALAAAPFGRCAPGCSGVRSGHLKLDFTQAVITQPSLQLDAEVRSGHIILITKPGIVVDADDVAVRSGHVRVRAPWGPDVPEVLRIEVSGKVGSGHFVARPQHRTFWQWLTRQPRPYEIAAR
jgi:hypothetical protein